jgi:uncharacterized protein YoxC
MEKQVFGNKRLEAIEISVASCLYQMKAIQETLRSIERKVDKVTATQTDLDNAINALTGVDANLAASVSAVVTDINNLVAKIDASPQAPDFSGEVTNLKNSTAAVNAAITALQGADLSVNAPAGSAGGTAPGAVGTPGQEGSGAGATGSDQ